MPDLLEQPPEKTGISLIRCNNEKELRRFNADQLSRELWHNDMPRVYPTYLVFYHGRLCGFFQTVPQMVVYPAMHPEQLSSREFLKVTRSLVTEFKRLMGNPIIMLCDKVIDFGPKNLKRVRLKRAPETAFVYDEEAE
jgi:hypothetical protein